MSKKSKLVQMLREIIKREVQKEVKKIFISEGYQTPKHKMILIMCQRCYLNLSHKKKK